MRSEKEIQQAHDELTRRYLAGELTVAEDVIKDALAWVLDPFVIRGDPIPDAEYPDDGNVHEECCPGDGSCCDEVHCEQDSRTGKCNHCVAVHCGTDTDCIPAKGTGVPLLPDIDALRALWVGKNVRTSRTLTKEEYREWVGGLIWKQGYSWGGAGTVVGFSWERGGVWLLFDDGSSWRIDAQTRIAEYPPPRTDSHDDNYRKPCGCTLYEGCFRCCRICDLDAHRCPGCGAVTPHEWVSCQQCRSEAARKASA